MSFLCDFHAHSTASDGILTPAELVREAHRCGVDVLALTDHDDVSGIGEARACAEELGLELLPGIELSVSEQDAKQQMHILGLGIDPSSHLLLERVVEFRRTRSERALLIVERLEQLGFSLSFERLRESARGAALGRPHVARALVEAGICSSPNDAFARFLRRGRPAYVPREGLDASQAISLIHDAGGIASLAHPPRSLGVDAAGGLQNFVARLVPLGLDGIEVYHPSHTQADRKRMRRLARVYDLVVTGGSDFHGDEKPAARPGRGRGHLALGREFYDAIQERLAERSGSGARLTPIQPPSTLARPA